MAKGYWIAHVDVRDPDKYKHYVAALQDVLRQFGGRYVVRAGQTEVVEGKARSRIIVLEFPSYQVALDCYRSGEYAKAIPLRKPHADVDLMVIDGYGGVQPSQRSVPPAPAAKQGYWIGNIDVTNPEGYKAYTIADMEPLGKFGGHFLVRGGVREVMEGKFRSRTVVLEFPSHEAALACYRSEDYQAAKKLRDGRAEADFVVLAGYDGQQP